MKALAKAKTVPVVPLPGGQQGVLESSGASRNPVTQGRVSWGTSSDFKRPL
jgi:hypothetical protein